MSDNVFQDPALQLVNEWTPQMTLGTTGLKQHAGVIDEEFLIRMRGQNAIKIYREMIDNSPTIAAALNAIKMLIRQVDWRVEPADESDEAKAEAEDTESALEDMSHTFEDFISEALSMIWAGYAPFEIIYKLRRGPDQENGALRSKFNDGKWGWRKIEIRGQETVFRWVFDQEGGIQGLVQQNTFSPSTGPVFIPIDKMLLFRMETFKGNPEGKSLIRPAVIPYWFIKRIQEFEAIGVERNLAGMPIMEVPPEILVTDASAQSKSTRTALEQFVTQVRMDERWGGLVPSEVKPDGSPSGYKFKLMQSSGRKLVDTDIIIKRYRGDMLMLFMAQFLTMGTEKVGSFSLASSMTNLFGTALGTTMDSIATIINRFLITRRQRLNGRPSELDPTIEHGDVEGPALQEVAAYIQAMAASGMVQPNEALERRLLEIGNLPQPPDDLEMQPPPLDENVVDAVSGGGLSAEQVRTLLEVNKSLKKKELDREAAIATIAAALGVDAEQAEKFIPAEAEDTGAPILPSVPPPPGEEEEGEEDEDDGEEGEGDGEEEDGDEDDEDDEDEDEEEE